MRQVSRSLATMRTRRPLSARNSAACDTRSPLVGAKCPLLIGASEPLSWLDAAQQERDDLQREKRRLRDAQEQARAQVEIDKRARFDTLDSWVREDLIEVATRTWGAGSFELVVHDLDEATSWTART